MGFTGKEKEGATLIYDKTISRTPNATQRSRRKGSTSEKHDAIPSRVHRPSAVQSNIKVAPHAPRVLIERGARVRPTGAHALFLVSAVLVGIDAAGG